MTTDIDVDYDEHEQEALPTAASIARRTGEKRRGFSFLIPWTELDPEMGFSKDVLVGFVYLRPEEEEAAIESVSSQAQVSAAMAKTAWRMFDGKPIDFGNQEQEVLWTKIGSKARNLIAGIVRREWASSPEAVQAATASFKSCAF